MYYLDNSSTTKVKYDTVLKITPYFHTRYLNPNSANLNSAKILKEIQRVREQIALEINCEPDEIYFTSGGCESNSWAINILHNIFPYAITTSPIEHHSVLNACETIFKGNVNYLSVDHFGRVNLNLLDEMLINSKECVSIMHGNNEIGTLQELFDIGMICKEHGTIFHTDAVQTFGHCKIDVKGCNIAMLSASGHKFGAPKGVGFLYIRNDIPVTPLIFGGEQERGMRGGTTNVPGIIGMGEALRIPKTDNDAMLMYFDASIKQKVSGCIETGSPSYRVPNHLSYCIKNIDSKTLVALLDEYGIVCSAGSACNSGNSEPSYVLKALGISDNYINGAIRFTFGSDAYSIADINYITDKIAECVSILRKQN